MEERAYFDDLLTQFILEQPDDTGSFRVSQVCTHLGVSINRRRFAGHVERLIGLNQRNRPFAILRTERVGGRDPGTFYHFKKKKPPSAKPSGVVILLPHEAVCRGL